MMLDLRHWETTHSVSVEAGTHGDGARANEGRTTVEAGIRMVAVRLIVIE